jgi:hypothetical protein
VVIAREDVPATALVAYVTAATGAVLPRALRDSLRSSARNMVPSHIVVRRPPLTPNAKVD